MSGVRLLRSLLVYVILSGIAAVSMSGCGQSAPLAQHAQVYQYDDPESNTTLRISADSTSISVAARLTVHIEVEWELGDKVVFEDTDWSSGGWELVDQIRSPVESISGAQPARLRLVKDVVLEPFLPGEYTIPLIQVHIQESNANERTIQSEPIPVQVLSVLTPDDTEELSPPSGEYVLPVPGKSDHTALLSVFIGVCLVVLIFLLRVYARRNRTSPEIQASPYDLLHEVAHSQTMDAHEGYEKVYTALTSLFAELQQTSEIRAMIEQCESARFSGQPGVHSTPETIAKHALEILGDNGGGCR